MTREEAIDVLKCNYPSSCFEELCKAVDIAIKALSAQPEIIRCKDCRHANECHKSVQYTRNEPNTITIGYSPIEWCSRAERRTDE